MSNYYDYREVKVMIAHKLMAMDGWKVYGYSPDTSDSMTDYYNPASWGGVAEKNGYILCVNVYGASEQREITQRNKSTFVLDKNIMDKISKLEKMTVANGASLAEEESAKKSIERLQQKSEDNNEDKFVVVDVIPAHMAHPPKCNWHIEKDGLIIAKGNGILKYSSVYEYFTYSQYEKNINEFRTQSKEKYISNLTTQYMNRGYYSDEETARKNAYSQYDTMQKTAKLIDDFNKFVNKLDTTCGCLVGEGDLETYEKVIVTEYKTETKAVETMTGSLKEGQCFIVKTSFNYGHNKGYVYRIHVTEHEGRKNYHAYKLNGKLTKECTGNANASNHWYITENFVRWFEKGSLAWCELQEVRTPYEVEKVVKKTVKSENNAETKKEIKEPEQQEQPEQTTTSTETAERKYYTINEQTARIAKNINSFAPYTEGEATEDYKHYCNKVYDVLDKIRTEKPALTEKAEGMTDRYCRKLADYYNDYYRNESSCPSIMISGGSNFPVRKKEKQNSRRRILMDTWNYLQGYAEKIKNLLTQEQPILSNDENAIQLLTDKIVTLEESKETMKAINKYYKKNGTIDGFTGILTEQLKKHVEFMEEHGWNKGTLFDTASTNAEINRLKARVETLQKEKDKGTTEQTTTDEEGNELFKVIENTEIMRLQLLFDGKPDEETRNILKKNGFRWSPKNLAWQRQLTDNARYSLKKVAEQLKTA